MNDNKLLTMFGMGIAGVLAVIAVGVTISSFAPDATAQRIEACMTQSNMQYVTHLGMPPMYPY